MRLIGDLLTLKKVNFFVYITAGRTLPVYCLIHILMEIQTFTEAALINILSSQWIS